MMAADPTAPPPNPLAPFTKLGPSVYIQDPTDTTTQDGRPVIFIAFWMNAPPRALAKYVVEYRRMAPSARIIFIRSSSNDFFFRSTASAQQARVAPAVAALRASTPETPVFMHLFSNGGLFGTTHLLKSYHRATGHPLPISSMIIDSAPGTASISAAMRAFSYALPKLWIFRLIGKSALWITLVLVKIFQKITRSPDAVSLARKAINDTSLLQAANAQGKLTRCYIYSDADDLVNWRDVERHASESAASGWMVRHEKFQGTPHVGHMRAQPERYWSIVKEYLEPAEAAS